MTEKSICPKRLLLLILTVASLGLAAQTVTLTFTAKDAANHYVQLNKVVITNLTKSWQETIWWPDTVLQMQNGTGISDHAGNNGFALSQNNPNPFSGSTDATLTVVEDGSLSMEISDVNGRIVETQNLGSLPPGAHQFRITLAVAGTYVLTARQNGETSSIKMICNGGGGANTIDYLGEVQTLTYVLKSSTNNPFNFGDMMEYVGYASINGSEEESQRITQAQGTSQTFTLQFAVTSYQVPTVTTQTVTNVMSNSATCGGIVNYDGGTAVTAYGVCWSITQNPTVSGYHTTDGSGTGSFTSNLTGLSPNTTYYVRAYATNAAGTAYGQQQSFSTTPAAQPCPGMPTVTDYDGNTYNTIQIGTQCWMKENLKTTHLNNGVSIPFVQDSATWVNTSTAAYYYHNLDAYGCLYNFNALKSEKLCPAGWRVPTYDEVFTTLSNTLGTGAGGKMKTTGTTYWISPNTGANNNSGFSARGGGNCLGSSVYGIKEYGTFWTSTLYPNGSGSYAYDYDLEYNGDGIYRRGNSNYDYSMYTAYGLSVRCIHDDGNSAALPSVTISALALQTHTSANCYAVVTDNGGATIIARGVCWSTSQNPTLNDNHTTESGGIGSFSNSITGLTPGTLYYLRAYVTNSAGISYSDQFTLRTSQPCPGAATVTDYDGNVYNTVQIGSQCWIRENLRSTHYSNGTSIPLGNDTSSTTAYRYYPGNNISNVSAHGYLYNWKAAIGNSTPSDAVISDAQGICPTGWHLPSQSEWGQLDNYVYQEWIAVSPGTPVVVIDDVVAYLSRDTGWVSSSVALTFNNFTGFSAIASGIRGSSGSFNLGYATYYWSSRYLELAEGDEIITYYIQYNDYDFLWGTISPEYGISVRCVKN